jgi:hypothetical protein
LSVDFDNSARSLDAPPAATREQPAWQRILVQRRWDGFLPLIAPVSVLISGAVLNGALNQIVVVFVPIGVALARATIGKRELERVCGGPPGVMRQIVLAMAIAWLLLLEAATGFCALANPPLIAWAVPVILYVIYFVTIYCALRPPIRLERPGQRSESTERVVTPAGRISQVILSDDRSV